MQKIHIASEWTGEGGSTESLIGLTNMFNKRGIDAVLYGPQEYHLDKCRGSLPGPLDIGKSDVLIGHIMELDRRPACRKVILSCHEKHYFPLQEKSVAGYDLVQFLSESQRAWHRFAGKSIVIPPNLEAIAPVAIREETDRVAGVIGTVFPAKHTHVSIERALRDGMRKVLVFGNIGDPGYFEASIRPLLSEQVTYMGQVVNKQEIYNSLSCVYQSSESETYGRVKAECRMAGIEYRGTPECDIEIEILPDDQLFLRWMELLEPDE